MHTLALSGADTRYGVSGEIVSGRIEEGQAYILRTRASLHRNAARSHLAYKTGKMNYHVREFGMKRQK
jgi:hypothetical protein